MLQTMWVVDLIVVGVGCPIAVNDPFVLARGGGDCASTRVYGQLGLAAQVLPAVYQGKGYFTLATGQIKG